MAGIDYTTKSVPFSVTRLGGGLNSTASGLAVRDDESTDCQNVDFDIFGSFKKRHGYTTLNSSAFNSGATWTGLHWFEKSDGTTKLIGVCGNKVARMDDLDGTWNDVTGAITVTAGNNNHVSSTTFLDTVLMTNNVDVPFQVTDSGNAAASTVPTNLTKAKFVSTWQNYAFYANVTVAGTAHPSRIYWSNLKTIGTWTATDFADISQNDGQEIEGIMPLGDALIIFKTRSVHKALFTGDSDVPFVFTQTTSHVGSVSGYSLQKMLNGIRFLSYDGDYFFDGENSTKLSDRIGATLDTFGANRFKDAVSAYQQDMNRYWLSFTTSGGSSHDRIVTWDSQVNAYSLYTGIAANCFAIIRTSGEERIYFGDYSGFVYRADTGSNDNPLGVSTAISAYYKTKWFNFDDLIDKKGVPHVTLFYRISSSTISLGYSYDFEDATQNSLSVGLSTSSSVYGSAIFGVGTYAASGGAVIRKDLKGRGRVVRFTFTNSTLSETFQIDGLGLLPHLETV